MDKNKLAKCYHTVCDIVEVYLPSLIFVFMFLSYVVLIVYRYVFRASFDWLYELNTMSFVWCGIFAASYGSRSNTHVQFTILYDRMPEKVKLAMDIIANVAIITLFIAIFPKAIKNLAFQGVRKSSILKIPYNIVFLPFLCFVALTVLHHAILLGKNLRAMFGKGTTA